MAFAKRMLPSYTAPSGNRIVAFASAGECSEFETAYFASHLYLDSGTSALIIAIADSLARSSLHPTEKPEVILPAYCCPDIVSAIAYAGAKPVLLDFSNETPWLDLELLESAITPRTIAVVAVNFLGIPERVSQMSPILSRTGVRLIYDCCQWFPAIGDVIPMADYVAFSFGRGKPVTLLSGGAVFSRQPLERRSLDGIEPTASGAASELAYRAKLFAYRIASNPYVYALLDRIGLAGKTRFHSAHAPRRMPKSALELLPSNIAEYRQRQPLAQQRIHEILRRIGSPLIDLPARLSAGATSRLLRYPVLCRDIEERDAILNRLRHEGIGASAFYMKVLPEIRDIANLPRAELFPFAKEFSRRLLTIPVHTGITEKHLDRIEDVLDAAARLPS